jgi:hypothetical protein
MPTAAVPNVRRTGRPRRAERTPRRWRLRRSCSSSPALRRGARLSNTPPISCRRGCRSHPTCSARRSPLTTELRLKLAACARSNSPAGLAADDPGRDHPPPRRALGIEKRRGRGTRRRGGRRRPAGAARWRRVWAVTTSPPSAATATSPTTSCTRPLPRPLPAPLEPARRGCQPRRCGAEQCRHSPRATVGGPRRAVRTDRRRLPDRNR